MVQEWFVVRDGNEFGPFALETLKDRAAEGLITPDMLIRHVNAKTAVKACTIKELFAENSTPPNPVIGTQRPSLIGANDPRPSPKKPATTRSVPPPLPQGGRVHPSQMEEPLSLDDDLPFLAQPRDSGRMPVELVKIAKWHRWLIRAAVLYLLVMIADLLHARALVLVGFVLILIVWPPVCYALARGLRRPPLPYALIAAVPLINLLVLIDLSGRATQALRAAGIEVGFFGVRGDANFADVRRKQHYLGGSDRESQGPEKPNTPPSKWFGYVKSVGQVALPVLVCAAITLSQYQAKHDFTSSANTGSSKSGVLLKGRVVPKPEFRDGDVVWTDNSLADEARRLANALRETGYTKAEKTKRVELSRSVETRVVRVCMTAADADTPRVQRMLKDYAGPLWGAMAFEEKPLELKLCDENRVERHSYTVEPSSRSQFGPQCYVYHPTTLKTDAERFGRFLTCTGAGENPVNWTLARREDEWSVCLGLATEQITGSVRASFRQAARQISDEVFGGQRVELWLFTNQGMESFSANR